MTQSATICNYVHGEWHDPAASEHLPIVNPATGEELGRVPLSSTEDVDDAADPPQKLFPNSGVFLSEHAFSISSI